jgi:hypothetical protein
VGNEKYHSCIHIFFRRREGRKNMALISDSTPSTAIPRIRKGSRRSHIMGYNTSASIASGAHKANNISQSKKVIILNDLLQNSLFQYNLRGEM